MTANSLCSGGNRGGLILRFAGVFLAIVTIFYFALPHAQSAYDNYKAGEPIVGSGSKEVDNNSHYVGDAADSTCLHLPGADKVMVILKTGATELYDKLPVHFVTTFACIPHFAIYSDLEQDFAGVHIHDGIAPVSEARRKEHSDFKLYREIRQWWDEGQDLSKLKGTSAWTLDRWRFLPMFHMAFEEAPEHIEWFFFMEADTSMSWLNLLLWIQTLDSSKPYYMGAQTMLGELVFAHGGSGILLSRTAAKLMEAARDNAGHAAYDEAWENKTAEMCCGDAVIAAAFQEIDIPLTGAWPVIQGSTVSTVDFTTWHWCQPPVTWHHVKAIQVDAMWQFEHEWTETHGWQTPYLYRDVFEHFLQPYITENRTSWNNLSNDQKFISRDLMHEDINQELNRGHLFSELEDFEQESVNSQDACAAACRRKEGECIQWMFQPGKCFLGRDVHYGASDEMGTEHWTSGWLQDRVEAYKKEQNQDCAPNWPS